jgi:chemotaxis protein methyltransferase CheR
VKATATEELAPSSAASPPPLEEADFARIQKLVYAEAGIRLGNNKQSMVTARLMGRVRELGVSSFDEYVAMATQSPGERDELIDRLTTHETAFFRFPEQFGYLEGTALPQWRADAAAGLRPKKIRAWSAACATGEEAYSLAMVLDRHLTQDDGWSVEVLASDISLSSLESARQARWPAEAAEAIPSDLRREYMLKGRGRAEGVVKAGPELRARVELRRVNLHRRPYEVDGLWDVIFCRNVLIYFDRVSRLPVLRQLLSMLTPSGLLFMGESEALTYLRGRVQSVAPMVYQRGPE